MVPFSNHCTASLPAANNRHRLKIFRKFINRADMSGCCLDIGPKNYIGTELGIGWNTVSDLNFNVVPIIRVIFHTVTCFEVLNHNMNPLLLLQNIHSLMEEGGCLYLSTPKSWLISWYHGPENFVEYKKDQLLKLIGYAGFKVVRYEVHNPWPWYFIFYGIRPVFRYIFNRFHLIEAIKI